METVIAELGTALICLLAGSYMMVWLASLLRYVSVFL